MSKPPPARPGARLIALVALLAAIFTGLLPAAAQGTEPGPAEPAAEPEAAALTQRLFLPALSAGGPSGPGDPIDPNAPTSDERIAEALERGAISAEQALTYRVFAAFGDPRLPAAFRGPPGEAAHAVIRDLADAWASLSPAAQATLQPFSLPPYYPGSWWDLRSRSADLQAGPAAIAPAEGPAGWGCTGRTSGDGGFLSDWRYLDSPGLSVRFWYHKDSLGDKARAERMALKAEDIYLKLAALMRRTPPSDNGSVKWCGGGSDALDISLFDLPDRVVDGKTYSLLGLMTPMEPTYPMPSYISLDNGLTDANLVPTLIHEMMHSFQRAYKNAPGHAARSWWDDATADWAVHYYESLDSAADTNDEHGSAFVFLNEPHVPLDDTRGLREYGANVFPFFLQIKTGTTDAVRLSYEKMETETRPLVAINASIPGGFARQWPAFALHSLNRPPVDDFLKADALKWKAELVEDMPLKLNGASDMSHELPSRVKYLSTHVFRYTFTSLNERSVALVNPFRGDSWPTAALQVVYRIGANWKVEDITGRNGISWCRDLKAQRVEELYVVISNHEHLDRTHQLKPDEGVRINITNIGCRGWDVKARVDIVAADNGDDRITETVNVTARLERYRFPGNETAFGQLEGYATVSGKVEWSHSGVFANCSGSAKGSYNLTFQHSALFMQQYALKEDGTGYQPTRKYGGYGGEQTWKPQPIPYKCPNGRIDMGNTQHGLLWLTPLEGIKPVLSVDPSGTKIVGKHRMDMIDGWHDFSWTMTALPPE